MVGGIFQGFSRTLEMDPKKDPTGWGPKKKDRPRHNPTTVNERRGPLELIGFAGLGLAFRKSWRKVSFA